MTTASEMLGMLERHYAPPPSKPAGGVLMREIQAPNSSRRADALYLPITTAGRGTIIGHEVKVARSDVIAELRDPHKADSWLRFCTRWWLVVSDAAFLDGLDVPPEWGVLSPPARANTRFMTVVRSAPRLTPEPSIMTAAWGTIFARLAYAEAGEMHALESWMRRANEAERRITDLQSEIRRLRMALGEQGLSATKVAKVTDVLAEVERLGGYGDGSEKAWHGLAWGVDAEQVARGILAALAKGRATEEIANDLEVAISRGTAAVERLIETRALLEGKA